MKKYVNNSFITKSPSEYKNGTAAVTNLPVTIYTDGQPVSSYTLKGNTSVSGTPSPQNPVTVDGVGEETANLFDKNNIEKYLNTTLQRSSYWEYGDYTGYVIRIACLPNTTYTLKYFGMQSLTIWRIKEVSTDDVPSALTPNIPYSASYASTVPDNYTTTFTTTNSAKYILFQSSYSLYDDIFKHLMLNTGSTPPSYEPYGYKISILKGLTPLTPIYLSQQLLKVGDYSDDVNSSGTVNYKIGKYVITGQEDVLAYDSANGVYRLANSETGISRLSGTSGLSTHFVRVSQTSDLTNGTFSFSSSYVYLCKSDVTTARAFKTYLQQQYEAGTPVIIYYVLATETTESVTVPEITTTGGEVTIDVDTTVKPSELDLTYHGWHEHQPLKRENGAWT